MILSASIRRFSYVPPKPPSMRKVVREKDKYVKGVYEMNKVGINALIKNVNKVDPPDAKTQDNMQIKKENTWYTVY